MRKFYKLEQRKRTWQTVASASHLDELIASYEKLETANGKRVVRNDGKIVMQELPEDHRDARRDCGCAACKAKRA